MHCSYAKKLVLSLSLATLVSGGLSVAAASPWDSSPTRADRSDTPHTPNQCIRLNGGDYNACNVGNSGRGDLPYRHVGN